MIWQIPAWLYVSIVVSSVWECCYKTPVIAIVISAVLFCVCYASCYCFVVFAIASLLLLSIESLELVLACCYCCLVLLPVIYCSHSLFVLHRSISSLTEIFTGVPLSPTSGLWRSFGSKSLHIITVTSTINLHHHHSDRYHLAKITSACAS